MKKLFVSILTIVIVATLSQSSFAQRKKTGRAAKPKSTTQGRSTQAAQQPKPGFGGTTLEGTDILKDPNKPQSGFAGQTAEGTDVFHDSKKPNNNFGGTTFEGTDILKDPKKPQSSFGGTTAEGTDISRTNVPTAQLPVPCDQRPVKKGPGAPRNTQRPCNNQTANPGGVAGNAGQPSNAATSTTAPPKADGIVYQKIDPSVRQPAPATNNGAPRARRPPRKP